ncbi:MAG TPA: AsmA-like C-terminal region-containing protein, partial [Sphingobacteriaceae bacterium]
LIGIIALVWMGIAVYVNTHKQEMLTVITRVINQNLNGKVTIESIEPALIKGFPGISLQLNSVRLIDSLQHVHKRDMLKAREVYVAVNAFSLLSGKPRIQDLSIENGSVYLFTDTQGYSNSRLFKRNTGNNKGNKINRFSLRNIRFTVENRVKNKLYSFSFRKLNGRIKYHEDSWSARLDLNGRINKLVFNPLKGSYLQNKIIRTGLNIEYSHKTHKLKIPLQQVNLDNDSYQMGGTFTFAPNASDYNLHINAKEVPFRNAADLLTPRLKKRMADYDFRKPIDITANINGRLKGKNDPLVKVLVKVRKNTFIAMKEEIKNCSFDALFINEMETGKPRKDPNSKFAFYQMQGEWRNLPFKADTINIVNLSNPILQGRFTSSFPLTRLNNISGGQTFLFRQGTAKVNVFYKAPFNENDTGHRYIFGTVGIENAGLTYTPRNLPFENVRLKLDFKGEDLFLRNVSLRSGRSVLNMEGSLRNFLNLYYESPQDILLDWSIASPQIDLSQFLAFLGKRRTSVQPVQSSRFQRMFTQLDQVLNQAQVRMNMKVDRLTYKKFLAQNLRSEVTMKQSGIALNNISFNHANGRLRLKGNIDQSGSVNKTTVQGKIQNVDISKLFFAFDNFGQKGITYNNLKGKFSSDVKVRGTIRENGQLISRSIFGTVNFQLRNGALVNFEPMQKIGDFAFPKRNFSNITFANLNNTLDIQGSKIHIRPMFIQSSVLNVFVEGTYGLGGGTDILLRVPLRNPEKDKLLSDSLKKKNATKGIVLNLRAVEEEGRIRIKLGKGDREETSSARQEDE